MLGTVGNMAIEAQFRSLGSIERVTRRELILDRLRSAVSTGELAPGTHLAETELSASLGVSRGTLREALRHLEEEGLLSKDSRGRLSVRVVTPAEVREIFDVRFALESAAAEIVCQRDDLDAVVPQLREALARMEESERGSIADQVAADIPIGRVASTEEIAAVFAFLSSDDAGYIQGTNIDINGASHLH